MISAVLTYTSTFEAQAGIAGCRAIQAFPALLVGLELLNGINQISVTGISI
jgi:hypothetical protein